MQYDRYEIFEGVHWIANLMDMLGEIYLAFVFGRRPAAPLVEQHKEALALPAFVPPAPMRAIQPRRAERRGMESHARMDVDAGVAYPGDGAYSLPVVRRRRQESYPAKPAYRSVAIEIPRDIGRFVSDFQG